jgi:hypothetical protein
VSRSRAGVILALLAALLSTTAALPAAAQAAEGMVVAWHVDSLDPLTVELQVTNESGSALPGWQVDVPFRHLVTEVTGAISVQDGRTLTLSDDHPLGSGATDTVHLQIAALGPAPLGPATCTTISAATCTVAPDSDQPRALPEPSPSPARAAQLALDYRVVDDWGSGQQVEVSVTNEADTAAPSWVVAIPADVHVSAMSGAQSTSGGGVIRAIGASDSPLSPADTVSFQVTVEPGRSPAWTQCRAEVAGAPAGCTISAAKSWLGYPQLPGW